jgi:CheY-like chemotaxis protein
MSPSTNDKTLLIVEDDDDLRETLAEILTMHGFDPVTAGSGSEALDVLHRGPRPRVIILDLMMPGMSGWDFRDAQLRDPALASIPVVLVSGVADLVDEAQTFHAVACFSKPLNVPVLVGVLRDHCP